MQLKTIISEKIKNHPVRAIALGIILIVVITAIVVAVGNTLDHIPVIAAFDRFVYETINLGPHPAWLDTIVSPFNFNFLPWGGTFIPSFLYFVFAIGFIDILFFNRKDIGWALVALVVAVAIDYFLFKITNTYVVRDRPFVHLPNSLSDSAKAIWINWPTYPSGHVRDMALYSSVLSGYAKKLTILFVIVTIWVGYTRIYLGAHYPTDVLAGFVLGYGVGLGVLLIVKSVQFLVRKRSSAAANGD